MFTIILDADRGTGGNQGLSTASRVMYSSHGSFGTPIPEPETVALVALGLGALALAGRVRRLD